VSPPAATAPLSPWHRAFDRLFPVIRFFQERLLGQEWFTELAPGLWLGGAPLYDRDYRFLTEHGIGAVAEVRAERTDDLDFLAAQGIAHARYPVPDVAVPDPAELRAAADWVAERRAEGRTVLVHCAKGRGRSAAVAATYLMRHQGLDFAAARDLIQSRRKLARLEERHRVAIEAAVA
jgi:protein-tyrosine phosphatase